MPLLLALTLAASVSLEDPSSCMSAATVEQALEPGLAAAADVRVVVSTGADGEPHEVEIDVVREDGAALHRAIAVGRSDCQALPSLVSRIVARFMRGFRPPTRAPARAPAPAPRIVSPRSPPTPKVGDAAPRKEPLARSLAIVFEGAVAPGDGQAHFGPAAEIAWLAPLGFAQWGGWLDGRLRGCTPVPLGDGHVVAGAALAGLGAEVRAWRLVARGGLRAGMTAATGVFSEPGATAGGAAAEATVGVGYAHAPVTMRLDATAPLLRARWRTPGASKSEAPLFVGLTIGALFDIADTDQGAGGNKGVESP